MRKSNPRLVVEQFMNSAVHYKREIFDCNEDFFLNIENFGLSGENVVFGKKIRSIWRSSEITNEQKAYIWLYFQKLFKAGERVTQ